MKNKNRFDDDDYENEYESYYENDYKEDNIDEDDDTKSKIIGEIIIKSGRVIIGDPQYANDENIICKMYDARKGRYEVGYSDGVNYNYRDDYNNTDEEDNEYVYNLSGDELNKYSIDFELRSYRYIYIIHSDESISMYSDKWQEVNGFGIDSGMGCIVDYKQHQEWHKSEEAFDNFVKDIEEDNTIRDNEYKIMTNGVICKSKYEMGDISIKLYTSNVDGKVVGVLLMFKQDHRI